MSTLPSTVVAELTARLPPNDDPDRPLMQVATVGAEGRPDVRTVLLTAWDLEGFVFNTDAASRKAAQIAVGGAVALCVVDGFAGQIVVQGDAEPLTAAELQATYRTRSLYLKQLAWQNTQALAMRTRADRQAAWSAFAGEHDSTALDPPPTWTGYRVRPTRITLWTPDRAGPSHREEHSLDAGGGWTLRHLPG